MPRPYLKLSTVGSLWLATHDAQWVDREIDSVTRALLEAKAPPRLCHYTDWPGLKGILTCRNIWAVDFRKQATDQKEFRHANSVIERVARDLQMTEVGQHDPRLLANFLETFLDDGQIADRAPEDMFIACFCERHDSEHVWAEFGRGCTGFAIELNVLDEEHDLVDVAFTLEPVDYSEESVAARVRSAFVTILALHREHRVLWPGDDRGARRATQGLLRASAALSSRHKSATHARDEEWRLVVLRATQSAFPSFEKPKRHVKYALRRSPDDFPSIAAIHVGSRAVADAESQIVALLEELKYPNDQRPPVVRSRVECS